MYSDLYHFLIRRPLFLLLRGGIWGISGRDYTYARGGLWAAGEVGTLLQPHGPPQHLFPPPNPNLLPHLKPLKLDVVYLTTD